MADVGVVKYKVELDDKDVGKQADQTQSTLVSKFGGAAKKIGAAALTASAAVATAATAAVVDLTKQAVSAYAEFEQLEGGVETLFKGSASAVMENANKAFETAGLSANQYMETVTSFSASLLQSLGGDTEKAAQVADRAIVDMSDNANKMGTSMESIQTAYQGFAKQNYTMLDNLKLGYGGTKEEMARLIKDASKMTDVQKELGITVDASSMSFGNIVNAISVMQTSMGIAGTTAKEASTTISGSIGMVKASWENVVTAIAGGDSEQLTRTINDLVESVETAAGNLLPVVEQALMGISEVVAQLAPEIAAKLPKMITDSLPKLLKAGTEAIQALAKGLISAIPQLLPTVTSVIMELARMIISMAPDIIQCGIDLLVDLAMGLAQALPELIPVAVDAILTIVDTLTDGNNLDNLIDAAIAIILALADGLISALPKLIEKAPEIVIKLVSAIIRNAPKIVEAATQLIFKLAEGFVQNYGKIIQVGSQLVQKVKDGFSQKVQDAWNWGRDIIENFIDGVKAKWEHLKQTVSNVANTVRSYLHFSVPDEGPLKDFATYAPDMMNLYAKGIEDNIGTVEDSVEDVTKVIAGSFSADVGYNLPDIAGYAKDLTASITASNATEIIVPVNINGREVARASAWYMNEQLAWEAR